MVALGRIGHDKVHALLCLFGMGVLFYTSYGLANWLAAQRAYVPEVVFEWEYALPFWAWTIVPYWSLNVFYALAFFVAQGRAERYRYMAQLVCAQAVAVGCFVLWPLQFSWPKPPVDGLSGWLFASLASFDAPYNQAPSLHIMLTMLVGRFYWPKLPKYWRGVWLFWLLLIALSVLTTYQHHFIDVPTGVLAGVLIMWCFPTHGRSPLRPLYGRFYGRWVAFYGLLAGFFGLLASLGGAWLWWCWPALSCGLLMAAYAGLGAAALQKQPDGRVSAAVMCLLLPYWLVVRLNMAYWLRGVPRQVAVRQQVYIGSILAAAPGFSVLDVCAEYPLWRALPRYRAVPMLDMVAPEPLHLLRAADVLAQWHARGDKVLLCCALGYGRSVAVVLVWLTRYGHVADLDEAVRQVRTVRPQMVLPLATCQAIEAALRLPESWHDATLE